MNRVMLQRVAGWLIAFLLMIIATMIGSQWAVYTQVVEALQSRITAVEIEQGKSSVELRGIKESMVRIESILLQSPGQRQRP